MRSKRKLFEERIEESRRWLANRLLFLHFGSEKSEDIAVYRRRMRIFAVRIKGGKCGLGTWNIFPKNCEDCDFSSWQHRSSLPYKDSSSGYLLLKIKSTPTLYWWFSRIALRCSQEPNLQRTLALLHRALAQARRELRRPQAPSESPVCKDHETIHPSNRSTAA